MLLFGIVFVIATNLFGLFIPEFIGYAIEILIDKIQFANLLLHTNALAFWLPAFSNFLLAVAILILACALLKGVFMFLMRQTIIVMSRKVEYDQKNEIYHKYQQLSTTFYKRNNTGDLMSRISEDVSRVRMYFGPAIMYLVNMVAMFILVIYTMFKVNAYLSFLVLLPLPVLAYSIYKISFIINRKSEAISVALSDLTSRAQEVYSGIRVIKSFALEDQTSEEFALASEHYKEQNISLAKTQSFFSPLMLLLIGLCNILVIYIGGHEVAKGSFTTGNIAEFIYYINMLTWPVASLGWAVSLVQRAEASQKRINEFLDNTEIIENKSDVDIKTIENIAFDKVDFTYPDTGIHAIKNMNFNIQQGERVAFIGKTGSSKSTIAELILRTYDIDEGNIFINKESIKEININTYRNHISYTPQDLFLFSDTVANNIKFGNNNATLEEIQYFAKIACVHDDIMELPKQYDTVVGERGVMLSGGQKQRISIARCLIKNPELIILDDTLSAVDAKTEHTIIKNLNAIFDTKTVIFITHRIFAIMNFDKIFVLDDGQIVEQGTHQSLLEMNGSYAEMYHKQQQEQAQKAIV
ncbi:MAG: ABC transporter ATP-binding protein [Chitinophagales bacterium]|nr:ABC transporter ATP-binding protein [Chitinophagales bacterium]